MGPPWLWPWVAGTERSGAELLRGLQEAGLSPLQAAQGSRDL